MKTLLTALFVLLWTLQAQALTWYVAPSGSGGDDARSCATAQTIGTPKATILSGLACLQANPLGNSLMIRTGTYAEKIDAQVTTIPVGTNWTNAPLISAYNGEVVTLRPSGAIPWILGMTQGYVQYVQFKDLILDGSLITSGEANGIKILNGAHHFRFTGLEIRDCGKVSGVWGQGVLTGVGTGPASGQTFAEFINMKVHDNGGTAQFTHGFYIETANNLIEGCEIYNNATWGISLYRNGSTTLPNNNIVRRNYVHNNARLSARGGINVAGPDNTVVNNIITTNIEGLSLGFGQVDRNLILNNTVYGNTEYGIKIESGEANNILQNNISYSNGSQNIVNNGTGTTQTTNLTTNPTFINAAGSDFGLQAASGAINTGTARAGYQYNGVSDIGAFETLTYTAGSATIVDDATDNIMRINFDNNATGQALLPATGCAGGFTARKAGANNPVVSCTRTGTSQISLVLTNGYTSATAADFTYTQSPSGTITDQALIGNLKNQRLNDVTCGSTCTVQVSHLAGGGSVPVLTQTAFQFRTLGGSEVSPDRAQVINTNKVIPPNTCTPVRIGVSNTVADFGGSGYTVYRKKNGLGSYTAIPDGPCSSTDICFIQGTGLVAPELTQGNTTEQLNQSGTFVAGGVMTSASEIPNISLTAGGETEVMPIICTGAGLSAGNYFELRAVRPPSGTVLDTYTQTPKITIGSYDARSGAH